MVFRVILYVTSTQSGNTMFTLYIYTGRTDPCILQFIRSHRQEVGGNMYPTQPPACIFEI